MVWIILLLVLSMTLSSEHTPPATSTMEKYKSPSKMRRSMFRFVKNLIKIINMKPKSKSVPNLSISSSCLTNYPEPCNVCHQNQCNYNLTHGLVISFTNALEESLDPLFSSFNSRMEESFTSFSETLSSFNTSLEISQEVVWKPPGDASSG